MKVIKQKKALEHRAVLAEEFHLDQKGALHPHKLYECDMIPWMTNEESNTVDIICTDPPYGIDAQNFNAQEGIKHEYNDTRENFERIIDTIATQGYRVCRTLAHAYVFHDFANWPVLRTRMEQAGWSVWPRPLIWSKGNGLLARPDIGPRYTYECILYAFKGDKPVTCVAPDVINVRTLTRQRRGAEKPAALYYDLLSRSVQPGDTVLDPCCGLGAIFPAANELSCKAIGIEIDPTAVGYAAQRLTLNLEADETRREAEDE
jgi:DNA modification methylase